ncbi:MAG TPA: SOS response-associated peptidase [Pseudobacteroides sp.]|uniref:SOS response-associated peptidase n=1 Tax=Pseudobacteroides sp. TaxID=1968840 RepID=UPI002F931823
MCGRFLLITDDDFNEIKNIVNDISQKYKVDVNGEVFPTNNIPAVYSHKGRSVLSTAKWGFPNFKNSGVIINAKAETLAEKPMFRKSFVSRRCLIPANGYYEWITHEDKTKTKYIINVKEKSLFYMAGLYNIFIDNKGNPFAAIAIITTEASSEISFIHNRMPVILQDESIKAWLDINSELPALQKLMGPYPVGKISFANIP